MPRVQRSIDSNVDETASITIVPDDHPAEAPQPFTLDDYAQMLRKYPDPLTGLRALGSRAYVDEVKVFPVDNLVQVEANFHLNADGDWVQFDAIGVYPLVSPYQKSIEAAFENAIKFALWRIGLKVEYAEEPAPKIVQIAPAPISAPTATPTAVAPARQPIQAQVEDGLCVDCGQPITGYLSSKGNNVSAEFHIQNTIKEYGVPLCKSCSGKRWAKTQPRGGYRR